MLAGDKQEQRSLARVRVRDKHDHRDPRLRGILGKKEPRLMEAGWSPDVAIHTPADVQQLMVEGTFPPEQQEWSPSLDLEEPQLPHVKEEQEELWSGQVGEQLQNPEKADITGFPFTHVLVKSENEEEAQPSRLHHGQTEENKEAEPQCKDCGGPEPGRDLDPATDGKISESSESETDDSDDDWQQTRTRLTVNAVVVNEMGEKLFSCSECDARFVRKGDLQRHARCHTGEKPFVCSVCGRSFTRSEHLIRHRRCHSEERPFSCEVCQKRFRLSHHIATHMRTHTGEKPFDCSFCGKGFYQKADVIKHTRVHTGEKPFTCSVCGRRFTENGTLKTHLTLHTGERPFTCTACKKKFNRRSLFKTHKCVVDSSNDR